MKPENSKLSTDPVTATGSEDNQVATQGETPSCMRKTIEEDYRSGD